MLKIRKPVTVYGEVPVTEDAELRDYINSTLGLTFLPQEIGDALFSVARFERGNPNIEALEAVMVKRRLQMLRDAASKLLEDPGLFGENPEDNPS